MSVTEETGAELEIVQDWTPFLLGDATPEFEDAEQASRDIVMQILNAKDVESVFEGADTTPARDLLGVPIRILSAKAKRSAYEGGATMFLLIDAVRLDQESGEVIKVTTGARNIMAQLYRLTQLNALPVACVIVESERPTAEGYRPLWLKR